MLHTYIPTYIRICTEDLPGAVITPGCFNFLLNGEADKNIADFLSEERGLEEYKKVCVICIRTYVRTYVYAILYLHLYDIICT